MTIGGDIDAESGRIFVARSTGNLSALHDKTAPLAQSPDPATVLWKQTFFVNKYENCNSKVKAMIKNSFVQFINMVK